MSTVYIAARLGASDSMRGFGAEWVYPDYDGGVKIAAVPTDQAGCLKGSGQS